MATISALTISNRTQAPLHLWVEPWGNGVEVPPGAAARAVGTAERPGEFELEAGPGGLTLWAWPTSSVQLS